VEKAKKKKQLRGKSRVVGKLIKQPYFHTKMTRRLAQDLSKGTRWQKSCKDQKEKEHHKQERRRSG